MAASSIRHSQIGGESSNKYSVVNGRNVQLKLLECGGITITHNGTGSLLLGMNAYTSKKAINGNFILPQQGLGNMHNTSYIKSAGGHGLFLRIQLGPVSIEEMDNGNSPEQIPISIIL